MAVAGARLDHGDLRALDAVADEAGAAARDEHIHHAAQPHEHIRGGTIGGLHDAHAIARETAGLHGVGEHMRDGDAGILRQRTAAQDACVARADADALLREAAPDKAEKRFWLRTVLLVLLSCLGTAAVCLLLL